MKKLILVLLLLNLTNVYAEEKALACSMVWYSKVKKKVEARGSYDKFKHCAVSCLLALRCNPKEVLNVGILKEGLDLLGYGNAEMKDLEADIKGINFVTGKTAKTDEQCLKQCENHFSESCQ